MPRLFIAVWAPPMVVELLAVLPREDEPGLRWTTPDQWHITLRFLGAVDETAAVAALGAVRGVPAVATIGPTVDRLGESVVVAPVAGLDALAAAVREATADIAEPHDEQPFRGHLTLARRRSGRAGQLVGHAIEATFPVGELFLVRSDLHAQGAHYSTVTSHPLGS